MSNGKSFTAATVQAAPVFLDRKGTVEKVVRLIKEAAGEGAELVVERALNSWFKKHLPNSRGVHTHLSLLAEGSRVRSREKAHDGRPRRASQKLD